ncbi:unnamed protein product [Ectocarpus sp. 13 AM-2016]
MYDDQRSTRMISSSSMNIGPPLIGEADISLWRLQS